MNEILNISPIDLYGSLAAILCGSAIGFERQWNGKPAGIRTSILICMSAYVFVAIGHYYQPDVGSVRIVGQIVTGIGFLGGGVILSKEGIVMGVTSAAVIWILAAIGCLIGLSNYKAAFTLTILVLLVLLSITFLEKTIMKLQRGVHSDTDKK